MRQLAWTQRFFGVALLLLCSCALACQGTGRGGQNPNQNPGQNPGLEPENDPVEPVVEDGMAAGGSPIESSAMEAGGAAETELSSLLSSLGVRYLPRQKVVEVDGWVNMQSGLIELFACAPEGKTHEAVVVLDCVPSGLHAGLLALGFEPGTPVEMGTDGTYRPPTGAPVVVNVRWKDEEGAEHTARAEDWVWDEPKESSMPHAPWIFAGSFLQHVTGREEDRTYVANSVKTLVSTYHDASSILENPEPEGVDDSVYFANERVVPAVGTPITAIFSSVE